MLSQGPGQDQNQSQNQGWNQGSGNHSQTARPGTACTALEFIRRDEGASRTPAHPGFSVPHFDS